MPRKESTSVYLDPAMLERLRRLQQVTRVPTAVRIRDALDAHVAQLEAEHAEQLAALPPTAGK